MDYQSIVVYTVINIAPPRLTAQATGLSEGCVTWFKNKFKRLVSTLYLCFNGNIIEKLMIDENIVLIKNINKNYLKQIRNYSKLC